MTRVFIFYDKSNEAITMRIAENVKNAVDWFKNKYPNEQYDYIEAVTFKSKWD